MNIETQMIQCRDANTELNRQLAWDSSLGRPLPGVLVVHGGAGLDAHAMHGFPHETGPELPGLAYHAPSDARSRVAMRDFLMELFDEGELPPAKA